VGAGFIGGASAVPPAAVETAVRSLEGRLAQGARLEADYMRAHEGARGHPLFEAPFDGLMALAHCL
jgi:hypothetical protein